MAHTIGFGEKASHLGHQLRPSRLVRERHVVLAVELHKTAVGDQARKQSALFDWDAPVALGMYNQNGTLDFPRRFAHVSFLTYGRQLEGSIGGGCGVLLIAPGAYMVQRPTRLTERGTYARHRMIIPD